MNQSQSVKKTLAKIGEIRLDVEGLASLAIDLSGTFVGTVAFEYSINGEDWYALTANIVGSSTTATGATAGGKWTANVAGFSHVRVRSSAYTSGTIKVSMRAVLAGGGSGSGSSSSTTDGSTFTAGTTGGNLMFGVYEATPTTVVDGKAAAVGIDNKRNLKTTFATALQRAIDSVTTYAAPCEITIVDLATDADVVVTAAPAVLLHVFVDTVMSAHVALIKDSTTTKITMPASSIAGYQVPGNSASFATNITVESDNAATGKLAIFWRNTT
jgi:hypothetical protein